MSDRESSRAEPAPIYGGAQFTRWPGLLDLTLGWVLPPVIALVVQQIIYAGTMYACGRNLHGVLHVVPALGTIVVIGTLLTAHRDWKRVGKGVEEEAGGVTGRTRFIAIGGMITSIFSGLVILAQWLAIFYFDPCMRA